MTQDPTIQPDTYPPDITCSLCGDTLRWYYADEDEGGGDWGHIDLNDAGHEPEPSAPDVNVWGDTPSDLPGLHTARVVTSSLLQSATQPEPILEILAILDARIRAAQALQVDEADVPTDVTELRRAFQLCGRLLGAEDLGAVTELTDIVREQLHAAELRWLTRHDRKPGRQPEPARDYSELYKESGESTFRCDDCGALRPKQSGGES